MLLVFLSFYEAKMNFLFSFAVMQISVQKRTQMVLTNQIATIKLEYAKKIKGKYCSDHPET